MPSRIGAQQLPGDSTGSGAPQARARRGFGPGGPVDPAAARLTRVHRGRILVIFLAVVAGIQVFTMPAFFYPGDNFAPRAEAVYLLRTGELGIPYGLREELGGLVEERGQYFFENDARQRLFSKYGVGYTLLYLPPLLVGRAVSGPQELLGESRSLLLVLNLYGVLLTLVAAAYLFLVASEYSARPWRVLVFALVSIYATFFWHYLRAPALEIFQSVFFLAFFYHGIRFLRARSRIGLPARRPWGHLALAAGYGGVLVAMKLTFAASLLVLVVCVLSAGGFRRLVGELASHARGYVVALAGPLLVILVLLLWVNQHKFGSPTNTGYGQWLQADGAPVDHFSLRVLPESLPGFFLRAGNGNVFLHFPMVLLALPFWLRFRRRNPADGRFLVALVGSNIALLSCFSAWHGEWGYGPRYLLFFLVIASLPALEGWEALVASPFRQVRWGAAALGCAVLGWSLVQQVHVNALHYFTYHHLEGVFRAAGEVALARELNAQPRAVQERLGPGLEASRQRVIAYFQAVPHRGAVHADLIAHTRGRRTFPPLQLLAELRPAARDELFPQLEARMLELAEWNFALADGSGPMTPRDASPSRPGR